MSDPVQEDLDFEEKRIQYDYDQENFKRKQAIHEAGLNNWKILNEGQVDQEKQFDKSAMTIAAGSFSVSFAFINTVIPLENATYLPVLAVSWAFFGLCIIVMLIGYRISSVVFRSMSEEEKRNIENLYENKPIYYKERSIFFNATEICNNIALITNIGGIICLILFVFLNFWPAMAI